MRAVLVASCLFLGGCPDRSVSELPPSQSGEVTKTIPTSRDIDILFVIDNSRSTQDKQNTFLANFPLFVSALDNFDGGRPNLHIGVTTTSIDIGTDLGGATCRVNAENGRLVNTNGEGLSCTGPTGAFIEDIGAPGGGPRKTNYSGTLEDTFKCIADRGTNGCGFESPLAAIQRALDGSHPENQGFLRNGAFLAVIILTDEDDCSAKDASLFGNPADAGPGDFRCTRFAYKCDQPFSGGVDMMIHNFTNCSVRTDSFLQDPATYFQFLSGIKDPSQIVVAVIGGDAKTDIATGPLTIPPSPQQDLALEPSCNVGGIIGRPALRLNDFVSQFKDHGLFRSVCQSDYSATLTDIGNLVFDAVNPCLEGDLDTRDAQPDNPGLQPDCTVSDITNINTDNETQYVMPACKMVDDHTPDPATSKPCWWVQPDSTQCPSTQTHLVMNVEREGAAPTGTDVQIACAIAP